MIRTGTAAYGAEPGFPPVDERHFFKRWLKVAFAALTFLAFVGIEGALVWTDQISTRRGLVAALEARHVDDAAAVAELALEGPRALGWTLVGSTALVATLIGLLLLRFLERARHRLLTFERLATAGTLAATIAHEIKNPMGIILSTTQLLARSSGLANDDLRLLLEIEEEVRRADDQLNAFLDLVRDMPMKRESCDLCKIARSTASLLAAQAKQARVTLELVGADDLDDDVLVIVDRRRLRQALVNLVLNSIESLAPVGGGTVSIAVAAGMPDMATVTVSDDGPGIPVHLQQAVFEAFTSTKPNGTGLGLSTARRIVERHGGRLELGSQPGKRTTMTMHIPRNERGSSGIFRLRQELSESRRRDVKKRIG